MPDPSRNFFNQGERVPKRVYASPNFTAKDGLPSGSPHTPISVAFSPQNKMLMVVDAYGNYQNQRVFLYDMPLPACSTQCSVPHSSVIPLTVSQASDASYDREGNLVILDHTWNRTLYFSNDQVPTPTPVCITGPAPTCTIAKNGNRICISPVPQRMPYCQDITPITLPSPTSSSFCYSTVSLACRIANCQSGKKCVPQFINGCWIAECK